MHLIEDSATVTGIQFNYPFSNLVLKGKLVTKIDSTREPDIFTGFLGAAIIILFLAIELGFISYSKWLITTISILFLFASWIIFLFFIAKVKIKREEFKPYKNIKSFFLVRCFVIFYPTTLE